MNNPKLNAAVKAMEFVEDGMVLGIGSGTTAAEFIKLLGKKIKDEKLEISGIPTSFDSKLLCTQCGVRTVHAEDVSRIDLTIDGADVVAKKFLVKGGGAALSREKIIAYSAKQFIVIVDQSKVKDVSEFVVPIEVLPFGFSLVLDQLKKYGDPKVRYGVGKIGPVISDNGNFIIDCKMDLTKPKELEIALNSIPGIVENGIFTKFSKVIVGTEKGAEII